MNIQSAAISSYVHIHTIAVNQFVKCMSGKEKIFFLFKDVTNYVCGYKCVRVYMYMNTDFICIKFSACFLFTVMIFCFNGIFHYRAR